MQYTIRIAIHTAAIWNFPRGRSSHCKNLSYLPTVFCSSHLWSQSLGFAPQQFVANGCYTYFWFWKIEICACYYGTFSGFTMATLQSGEASKHCIQHCLWSFSTMGLPKCIKTDNGPGYVGCNFQTFCAQLRIVYKTGIPYNPHGQGIVEQAHQTLQHQLKKLKRGSLYYYA